MKITNSISQKRNYKNTIIFLLILLLGISLRVYKLGSHDLWYDEAYSVFTLNIFESLNTFLNFISWGRTPPLFYILQFIWIKLFGDTEIALRFLPMIFGVISIIILYKSGKLFFNERVGLVSAFIFSISPIHIWYSQEARVYSLSIFLTMLIVYLFVLALERDKKYLWGGFIAASILGVYTNYFCILLILLSFLIIFSKRNRHLINKLLISTLIIISFSIPLIFILYIICTKSKGFSWILKPSGQSIIITFENFNLGYNATTITNLIAIILFFILLIASILNFRNNREKIMWSLFLFLFPIFTAFLISIYWLPIYIHRQLVLFSPFYYILIAKGITEIRYNLVKNFILVCISILISISLYNYFHDNMPLPNINHLGTYTKKPIKYIVRFVKERQKEGDAVFYSHTSLPSVFWYYWRFDNKINKKHFRFYIPYATSAYFQNLFKTYMKLRNAYIPIIIPTEQNIRDYQKKYLFKRIWLISSSWDRGKVLEYESSEVRKWMDSHYLKLFNREFDGIWIDLYTLKNE